MCELQILSRKEAAQRAGVTPAAISAAVARDELTRATNLNCNDYRSNGVYIFDDGYFAEYCYKVDREQYRNSGRKKFGSD